MERELLQAARHGKPVGVIIMDIDGFKVFNDSHGHKAGDAMLEALGNLLRKGTRRADVACRFGGEEFVIAMQCAPLEHTDRALYEAKRAGRNRVVVWR